MDEKYGINKFWLDVFCRNSVWVISLEGFINKKLNAGDIVAGSQCMVNEAEIDYSVKRNQIFSHTKNRFLVEMLGDNLYLTGVIQGAELFGGVELDRYPTLEMPDKSKIYNPLLLSVCGSLLDPNISYGIIEELLERKIKYLDFIGTRRYKNDFIMKFSDKFRRIYRETERKLMVKR